jgi:hypothetical protein
MIVLNSYRNRILHYLNRTSLYWKVNKTFDSKEKTIIGPLKFDHNGRVSVRLLRVYELLYY